MELLFGTFNTDKAREVQAALGPGFVLRTCRDVPGLGEVDETEPTLQGNALLKARTYAEASGLPTFADDTGLEVAALGGAPGVYSARFAGPTASYADNVRKLLDELGTATDRSARFRTVIAYYLAGQKPRYFEGILPGTIAYFAEGEGGFGYDPVFIPQGDRRTLAAYRLEEKNAISHRGQALRKLIEFLNAQ